MTILRIKRKKSKKKMRLLNAWWGEWKVGRD
jgi:hypothetical protein